MNPLSLILGFRLPYHPGEDDADLVDAWQKVYGPFIHLVSELPELRICLHLGGGLVDWMEARQKDDLALLKGLVSQQRVEILGGGYFDPVLGAIPERDAMGQVRLGIRRIEAVLEAKVRGAWLIHGAWDPSLPRILGRAGLKYALLDAAPFRAAGVPEPLGPYYTTEREGVPLALFPLDEALSLLRPRTDPERVVSQLRKRVHLGQATLSMFLDLREFGVRPGTHGASWGRDGGWVPRLLRRLASQDHWCKTVLPGEVVRRFLPSSRIYLPTSVLPDLRALSMDPDRAAGYSALRHRVHRGEVIRSNELESYLGGTTWDAFLARYEEANRLHKRMLLASKEVADLAALGRTARTRDQLAAINANLDRALYALYRSQDAAPFTNSPWGGLYSGRLRHEAYASLLKAEAWVRRAMPGENRFRCDRIDYDCDQREEVRVTTPHLGAMIDPDGGGALVELDSWSLPGNLLNCLARCHEAWHRPHLEARLLPALVKDATDPVDPRSAVEILDDDETCESTADRRPSPILPSGPAAHRVQDAQLAMDACSRDSFVDRFMSPDASLRNFHLGQFPEVGDFVGQPYELMRAEVQGELAEVHLARDGMIRGPRRQHSIRIVKRYSFTQNRPSFQVDYDLSNRYRDPVETGFGVELNLNLNSARGDRQYLILNRSIRHDLLSAAAVEKVGELAWVDEEKGFRFILTVTPVASLWHFPVENIGQKPGSTQSFFQGTCLLLHWALALWGEERWAATFTVSLATAQRNEVPSR